MVDPLVKKKAYSNVLCGPHKKSKLIRKGLSKLALDESKPIFKLVPKLSEKFSIKEIHSFKAILWQIFSLFFFFFKYSKYLSLK